ncbi:MAG: DUF2000 domain-containing protein [Eubacteriales bacterium]|nr:DUF2000 domain-containing protein [Eubacteriales bacterium]
MELNSNKCVMVIDEALPLGIIANTAGIMGITLGKYIPETVGPQVMDKSGSSHLGIIQIPVPVLKADREKIKEIRERLYQPGFENLIVVDFSDVAQSCNVYDDYIQKAASVEENNFTYFGIGICGEKKLVNKLTGSLPLLR